MTSDDARSNSTMMRRMLRRIKTRAQSVELDRSTLSVDA